MAVVGDLYVKLGMDTKGFKTAMAGVKSSMSLATAGMTQGIKAVGTATLATGAVIAGVGAKGVKDFMAFEKQLNEVFTLMPDISKDAMGKMEEDVKSFANEFGTLPEEVVPALYQAISASVPPDNVFNFLETAQKMAKGGVAELEVAVDALSSVVNAYGSEMITAGEASDLVFTAVKKGKTTVDEMAHYLFQAVPTASALGLGFENITASVASMTAQGTPTRVAMTQLRQTLVELSKSGTEVSGIFQEATGKTFKEFVAEGNNLADALEIVAGEADKMGVGVNDLFGSVEAGNAVLALTGTGMETFRDNLEEMENSAGATQQAFEKMEEGLQPILDKIKTQFKTLLLDVGDVLADNIEVMAGGFLENLKALKPIVSDIFGGVAKIMSGEEGGGAEIGQALATLSSKTLGLIIDMIPELTQGVIEYFKGIISGIKESIPEFLNMGMEVIGAILEGARDILPEIITVGIELVTKFFDLLTDYLPMFVETGMAMISKIAFGFVENADEYYHVLTDLIGTVMDLISENLPMIITAGMMMLRAIVEGIIEAMPTIINGILDVILTVVDVLIENLPELVKMGMELTIALARGLIDALPEVIDRITQMIPEIIEAFMEMYPEILGAGIELTIALAEGIVEATPQILESIINMLDDIVESLTNGVPDMIEKGKELIAGLWQGMKDSIRELIPNIGSAMKNVVGKIGDFLGIGSPSKYTMYFGEMMGEGLEKGMNDSVRNVENAFANLLSPLQETPLQPVGALAGAGNQEIIINANYNITDKATAEYANNDLMNKLRTRGTRRGIR